MQAVFSTNTTEELRQLLADLPLERIRRADPRRRAARIEAARRRVRLHLAMTVVVLTVWAAVAATTDATYFWPIWPILGAGIGLVTHALGIRPAGKSFAKWESPCAAGYVVGRTPAARYTKTG